MDAQVVPTPGLFEKDVATILQGFICILKGLNFIIQCFNFIFDIRKPPNVPTCTHSGGGRVRLGGGGIHAGGSSIHPALVAPSRQLFHTAGQRRLLLRW